MELFFSEQNQYAPKLDHTNQSPTGQYLMFHGQSSKDSTNFALTTTVSNGTLLGHHCLMFWFYEDGEGQFQLQLDIDTVGEHKIYASSIENRAKWKLFKTNIEFDEYHSKDRSSNFLQILYSPSTSRLKEFSIFAIDDITVRPGLCPHHHDYTYSFELGFEDLELERLQPLSNGIGQVYTPSDLYKRSNTVPPIDHTTNTANGSYYLFTNDFIASTSFVSALSITRVFQDDPNRRSCVRFAYQMAGLGAIELRMFVIPNNANSYHFRNSSALWRANFKTTSWTTVEVNKNVPYEHKIVFYMEKDFDPTTFVALDDLTVLDHQCQPMIDCDFESGQVCSYSPYYKGSSTIITANQFNFGLL